MKQITAEQRSPEWFEARLGRATASRFADVIAKTKTGYGAGRKNYQAEIVIERLTGEQYASFSSKAMEWGTETEDLARTEYMLKTGNIVDECGFYMHDELMIGASPDGLVGKGGGLEIKCPNPATHIETLRAQNIPKKYFAQVQGQMWLAELQWVDFVSFDPRMPTKAQIFIQRIARDEAYIDMLQVELSSFLRDVEADVDFINKYEPKKEPANVATTQKH